MHGGAKAPTPEALMRSRYSAYVLGDHAYITATWHPSTRGVLGDQAVNGSSTVTSTVPTKWMRLKIVRAETKIEAEGERGLVEYVARYKVGGRAEKLHEVSRFVLEDGRWFYLDGSFPYPEQA